RMGADHRIAPPLLRKRQRRAVHGNDTQRIALAQIESAELGLANPHRFARMISNTGCRLPDELDITCSTSDVAVCCSSASLKSSVRWRSSLSRRVFSIAMMA